ncbi:MAG: class I SAM-dependent methyltransferase [Deltaproteobacteria bacterium]|nr:class I SAM-dependent methyltransferase [Candidatus Zymogenaceae bacterium]
MKEKGNIFDGIISGAFYDRVAALFGFGPRLIKKAMDLIPVKPGQRILDLGCGTGLFCLALADRLGGGGEIHGVDLSKKQLDRARIKLAEKGVPFVLHRCSMDKLPFEAASFDMVVSSLAIHAVDPTLRRTAIKEATRVLKPGGSFILVDWTRPQAFLPRVWYFRFSPYVMGEKAKDNWFNTYPDMCRNENLVPGADRFISPYVRCQCFSKASVPDRRG